MEWTDDGVVIGVRRHGENSVIAEIMTLAHGRHFGLVRGGRSSRMRPILQPGNSVAVTWRARLAEHLGLFTVQADRLRVAAIMETPVGLFGLQMLADHLRLLPERDPHGALYRAALVILDNLDEPGKAARLMVRFELALLEELGFGLDLTRCAATGETQELAFVSPRSGRAVGRAAGQPWADRLLALPTFMTAGGHAGTKELYAGFSLTGYFLERDVWHARGTSHPQARHQFLKALEKALAE